MNRDPRFSWHLALALGALAALAACTEDPAPAQLPCDVQQVLAQRCQGCHNQPVQFGAPMPLLSHADLHAKSGDASMLERVAARIADSERPMPPPPNAKLSESERKVLEDWIAAGGPAAQSDTRCSDEAAPPAPVYGDPEAPPEDCQDFYEFRAHGEQPDSAFALPEAVDNDGNRYMCFYFSPPWGAEDKALWLHSLVDNSKVLHHWILYGSDNMAKAPGTSSPCSAVQAGSYFIAGWAPGGGDFVLPSNVEMDLPNGPNAGLILEVHYYKTDDESAQDKSGVRVCTAPRGTREQLAGVTFTGSEGICVDPQKSQTVSGMCDPADDRGDVHIIGAWPHMHKLGRHMKITVQRADGSEEVMLDEPFDFASQIYYPYAQGQWVLHPGDRLRTECTFHNDGSTRVPFGERTQDEMCYGFITSWPAGVLENDPRDITQLLGGPFQQTRRCMNPVSILQSCNGLADFPVP